MLQGVSGGLALAYAFPRIYPLIQWFVPGAVVVPLGTPSLYLGLL